MRPFDYRPLVHGLPFPNNFIVVLYIICIDILGFDRWPSRFASIFFCQPSSRSFSSVKLAVNTETFEKYAVKVMSMSRDSNARSFENEVQLLRQLPAHPSLTSIIGSKVMKNHDDNSNIGLIFFKFLAQPSLRDFLLAHSGPLDPSTASIILINLVRLILSTSSQLS